jgi:hypothetical protein
MPFQKGHPHIPPKKGTNINIARRKIELAFEQIVSRYVVFAENDKNANIMQNDMNRVSPCERLRFITDLAGYVLPKQKAVDITTQGQALDRNLTVNFAIQPDAVDSSK